MNLSSDDRDSIIRTVIGEVDPNDPDAGRAAVAHVIMNRLASGEHGSSATAVVHERGQFEPWMTRARELNAINPKSPEYQRVGTIVDGVLDGSIPDPTNGATHFLDRSIVSTRPGGIDKIAPWANGTPLAQIGHHTFYAPEGPVSGMGQDLLSQYTKPAAQPAAAPVVSQQDQDLLNLYTKPPVQTAQATPSAQATPAKPYMPITPPDEWQKLHDAQMAGAQTPVSGLHTLESAINPWNVLKGQVGDTLGDTWEAMKAGAGLTAEGAKEVANRQYGPSFPSSDPKTWSPGGLIKTGVGAAATVLSPVTGAIEANVKKPIVAATGNEDLGDRAALLAGIAIPGERAVATTAKIGRKLDSATNALDNAVALIGPENVPAAVDRLKANPRLNLMDVSDPVRVAGQGLVDVAQPEAMRVVMKSANDRMATQKAATNEAYSDTLGPVPDVDKLVTDLQKRAQNVGKQQIQPAIDNAKSVDITSLVKYIDQQITPRVLNNIRAGKDVGVPLTNTQRDFLELRDRLRGELDDRDVMLMDPAQAHEIQSALRYQGSTLLKAGGSDALTGGRYMDVRQRLVDAIDKASDEAPVPDGSTRYYRLTDKFAGDHQFAWFSTDAARAAEAGDGTHIDVPNGDAATLGKFMKGSTGQGKADADLWVTKDPRIAQSVEPTVGNYKAALRKYRDAKNVQEAFEDGVNTLQNRAGMKGLEDRPEFLMKWMANASPEEIEARKLGTRVAIDQKMQSVRNATRQGIDIPEVEFNRSKIAMLFGQRESDRLWSLMQDARAEANTNAKILQGSKTAETTAAQAALKPREVPPLSVRASHLALPSAVATAGLVSGLPEIGLAGLVMGALNAGAGVTKNIGGRIIRRADLARNIEFAKLATATGGEENPVIQKLLSHPDVKQAQQNVVPASNTAPMAPLMRDVITRGRGGRPIVTAPMRMSRSYSKLGPLLRAQSQFRQGM